MDCFQPCQKPDITDAIVDAAAKHFGIENDEGKENLKLFFELYSGLKMRQSFIRAFSNPPCERG